jgi:hypothetical protein
MLSFNTVGEENRMKSLQDALQPILSRPTPESLAALQGVLLALDQQEEGVDRALEIAGHFYTYLGELQSKITAKDYSELASRLDIGAVGVVALENIVATKKEEFWKRFLLGVMGEGLMIGASRQYIKAWEVETGLVHNRATWTLTEALWRTSVKMQPDLPPDRRWQAIQSLLAPAHDPNVPAADKAVLLGRVFQMLLLTHLAQLNQLGHEGPAE